MGHVYFSNGFKDCEDYFDFVGRVNFRPGTFNKVYTRRWVEEFCEGAVFIDTRSDYAEDDAGNIGSTDSYYFENKDDLIKFKVAFGGRN